MVINNFDIKRILPLPAEAQPPLVIDSESEATKTLGVMASHRPVLRGKPPTGIVSRLAGHFGPHVESPLGISGSHKLAAVAMHCGGEGGNPARHALLIRASGLAEYLGHLLLVFLATGDPVGDKTQSEGLDQLWTAGACAADYLIDELVALITPLGFFRRLALLHFIPGREDRLYAFITRRRTPR